MAVSMITTEIANSKVTITIVHAKMTTKLAVIKKDFKMSHAMRKCVFGSLRPGKTQTDLLSYRDQLESWNFGYIN